MLTKTSLIALLGVSLSCISSVLTTPATSTSKYVTCDTNTIKNKYKDTGKITYEHGPKKVTTGSTNFGLTTREYFVKIDETQKINGTGYWKYTDSQGQEQILCASDPSYGVYTIMEYENGRKQSEAKQEWVFSLATDKIYPRSASGYTDAKLCTTCSPDENNQIVDYMANPTVKSLPTLKSCEALKYWTGFAVPTGGPQPVSDITTFKWNNAKNRMKVVFNTCPNGNACNYKSSSIHYIRLQASRGTFVFWMGQDNTIGKGIKGTGVQSQTDKQHTYKKDLTSLPASSLKNRLQGKNGASPATRSTLGDDYVKVTVTHCWLKDGSQTELECSASKEKEIEHSDDGAAKK